MQAKIAQFSTWFRARSRGAQFGIGCGSLVVICLCCGLLATAINGTGNGNAGDGNTGASASTATTGAPAALAATATPTRVPAWTTVQTFRGSGNKKTATFDTPDDWRIVWSCDPSSFYGGQFNLIVSVYGSDGTPLDFAAVNVICKSGTTHDVTEEHQGGSVYLDIESEGAWTIQVQELT